MVLEIKIKNFFSCSEEVVLDFRAAATNSEKARDLRYNVAEIDEYKALKSILLYGANASGKSNLIKAIRFCHFLILESHLSNENTVFNFEPFKFGYGPSCPSSYFIRFLIGGIEYEYGFSLMKTEILTESLYYYPNGRIKKVFSRNERAGTEKKEKYSFGDVINRPLDVAESTSNKTLYLSRASQMDRGIAKDVFNYFHSHFILNYVGYSVRTVETLSIKFKAKIEEAIKVADSDIVGFEVKTLRKMIKGFETDATHFGGNIESKVEEYLDIKTYHKADPSIPFDFFKEESDGTKKLFFMTLTMLDIVENNKILLVDEIEESLHPHLLNFIFNLFKASKSAQLICTTHNTNFLDMNKFRKDQLYFVNKNSSGSSEAYSLYDFKDFRDTMDAENAYLQGRFDAVPIINESIPSLSGLIYEEQ